MDKLDQEDLLQPASDWRWVHFAYLAVAFFLSIHKLDASNYTNYDAGLTVFAATAGEGSIQREISFVMLGAYGIFFLFKQGRQRLRCRNAVGIAAILLCIWTLASYFWSDYPVASRSRLMGIISLVLVAMAVCRRFRPLEIVTGIAILTACYAAIGIPVEISIGNFHPWSPDYRYAGTLGSNEQGPNCAVAAIAAWLLWRRQPRKRIWLLVFAFALVFMFLTKSRTAILAFLIAFPAFQMSLIADWRKRYLLLSTAGVLLIGVTFLQLNRVVDLRGALQLGREAGTADPESLTGRLPLWSVLLEYRPIHPSLGFGYGAFWSPDRISDISEDQLWAISAAHSSYVDILIALGPLGLILFAGSLLLAMRQAWIDSRATQDHLAPAFFGTLLGFMIIDGAADSSIVVPSGFLCFALSVTLVYVGFSAVRSRSRAKAELPSPTSPRLLTDRGQ
jgi:exopolysaccharide production protein ExoQ